MEEDYRKGNEHHDLVEKEEARGCEGIENDHDQQDTTQTQRSYVILEGKSFPSSMRLSLCLHSLALTCLGWVPCWSVISDMLVYLVL